MTNADTTNPPHARFNSLDALRGLAALAIVAFHFSPNWAGYLAVDFFLVLSGFVLTHSYLYRYDNISKLAFFNHRFARLYPLHLFTLATFTIAFTLTTERFPQYLDGTLLTLIQNLTLTQNVGLNPAGLNWNFPSWSISVEFWVNVAFIFLVSRATPSVVLVLISAAGYTLIFLNSGHLDVHSNNYYRFLNSGLIRGSSAFLMGIVAYRVFALDCAKVIGKTYVEIITLALVAFVVLGRQQKLSGLDFMAPILFFFVVLTFSYDSGALSRLLGKFKFLGEISYSVYLNHITVLIVIRHIFERMEYQNKYVQLAAYLAIVIFYSHLTYKFIERPARNTIRNLIPRHNCLHANIGLHRRHDHLLPRNPKKKETV